MYRLSWPSLTQTAHKLTLELSGPGKWPLPRSTASCIPPVGMVAALGPSPHHVQAGRVPQSRCWGKQDDCSIDLEGERKNETLKFCGGDIMAGPSACSSESMAKPLGHHSPHFLPSWIPPLSTRFRRGAGVLLVLHCSGLRSSMKKWCELLVGAVLLVSYHEHPLCTRHGIKPLTQASVES